MTKGCSTRVTVTNRTHWQYRLYTDLHPSHMVRHVLMS